MTAAGWSEGYVDGVDYLHAFYRELSPAMMAFCLLLNGYRPPVPRAGGFRYAELGAGHAGTSTLLAALHPEGRFDAVDFNPSHIAGAARVVEDAGITNIRLLEESFAEFASGTGEAYDIVALHGVWSWVSQENRSILLDLLRRRLRPGGVVFLSYNALPGTLNYLPLRHLLMEHTASGIGPMPRRIEQAVAFAGRVAAFRSSQFARADGVPERVERLGKAAPNYIAHEYLNREWTAFYASDVARDMATAKLSFAGPAAPLDQLEHLLLPPEARALLDEDSSEAYRETLRDILVNRSFRRDLFVKGAQKLSAREQRERLETTRFILLVPADEVPDTIVTPLDRISLPKPLYGPLVDALAGAPQRLDGLLALPALAGHGYEALLQALMLLTGASLAAPLLDEDGYEGRREGAERFNRMVLDRSRTGDELRYLAAPALGSGVPLSRLECLFLLGRRTGRDPAALAWDQVAADGLCLSRDGRQLVTAEENLAELRQQSALFIQRRLPILSQLGIGAGPPAQEQ